MTLETTIAYAIALAIFAASPGPGVFATIAQAIAKGTGPAFALLSGLIVADIIYLVAAAAGLGVIAKEFHDLFTLVRIAGAAYLIWLGWNCWRQPVDQPNDIEKRAKAKSFLAGFSISLSNPKVIVFYLAFLPTFVDLGSITAIDVSILAAITAGLSYVVLGVYIFGARQVRRSLTKPSTRRMFNQSSGVMLVGAGLFVAAKS